MPFSVADLKQKASHAKTASVNSLQNTKDRFSSTPSKKATWGPYNTQPTQQPPLSPRASTSTGGTRPRPPVPSRRKAAEFYDQDDIVDAESARVDWANLSYEDKEAFFSWLDEFFSRFFASLPPKDSSQRVTQTHPSPPPNRGPPPAVAKWSKPKLSSTGSNSDDFDMSHPPSATHGSAAEDLTHYFKPSTHWDSSWYLSDNPLPPILHGNKNISHVGSWRSTGSNKTLHGGVVFSDLSICWFTVESSTLSADPNDIIAVKRKALYLPRPSPMQKEALLEAHETYGETIAAFAESYVGSGEVCARGECWDLAHEAIKYFDNYDYVPKPVPSLSRTHGHLIFEGKATSKGDMAGRWRGGDDRVRRGDIVEWRSVKIKHVGAPPNSWAILGDPDHTAIIVRDSKPCQVALDGQPLSPADLGSLEVVEQSLHSQPDRKTYDLGAFVLGEMWIYRPVGMQAYLGTLLEPHCPRGVAALEI